MAQQNGETSESSEEAKVCQGIQEELGSARSDLHEPDEQSIRIEPVDANHTQQEGTVEMAQTKLPGFLDQSTDSFKKQAAETASTNFKTKKSRIF